MQVRDDKQALFFPEQRPGQIGHETDAGDLQSAFTSVGLNYILCHGSGASSNSVAASFETALRASSG
jgi:hypothetical protein